jgi:transcriptional regulator GlxA family with amidase domain
MRSVPMVADPGVHTLDVVGPLEILATAKVFQPGPADPYEIAIVASEARPVEASPGLTITAGDSFDDVLNRRGEIDTLMIAGGHGSTSAMRDPDLIAFVRRVAPRVRRIATIRTGSLIFAEAGPLDGRRACTHWFWCPTLRDDDPRVTVDADAIHVRDGTVWTSAGVPSGMEFALALVEHDLGHGIALQVARFSVMS